ncbi:MAG: hypothetical protein K2Q21_11560 [Chitinophagaceae bacterium]|nr:hypothetical protein [Chitinophagaceae bacterium]
MTNLDFYKACLANEKAATIQLFQCLPTENLGYRPHPVNRSAREIVAHLIAHMVDLKNILKESVCTKTMDFDFSDKEDAAKKMNVLWDVVLVALNRISMNQWEGESVDLFIKDKPFAKLPRNSMMWFVFFDLIHHRGQLSSYVRPMGGKNPPVYGFHAEAILV